MEEGEEGANGLPTDEDQVELVGLHAKLYLFENGREAKLFIGSANATGAALQQNVEVLVELVGRTKDCGIASLLGRDDDPTIETLRTLLQEYQPPDSIEPPDDAKQALERSVDGLARRLGTTRLTAIANEVDEGQRWNLTLSGELPEIPSGVEVKVWPATLSAEAALRVDGPMEERSESGGRTDPTNSIVIFRGCPSKR